LASGEIQHGARNDLARLDQTAGVAKREELEAEADAIGGALTAIDQGEIGFAENVVAKNRGFGRSNSAAR
jgi:hypothetical protein